jgi:hypothetical protein
MGLSISWSYPSDFSRSSLSQVVARAFAAKHSRHHAKFSPFAERGRRLSGPECIAEQCYSACGAVNGYPLLGMELHGA